MRYVLGFLGALVAAVLLLFALSLLFGPRLNPLTAALIASAGWLAFRYLVTKVPTTGEALGWMCVILGAQAATLPVAGILRTLLFPEDGLALDQVLRGPGIMGLGLSALFAAFAFLLLRKFRQHSPS